MAGPRMSEPRALVEHFFRHEFGRLCAVLTRCLGVRRLDLVEDVVQAALVQALETWSRRGVPEEPAGWLFRTAHNLAIDALRRERTHALALPRLAEDALRSRGGVPFGSASGSLPARQDRESSPLEAHFADEIGDEPLRLLFVCCHEEVPAESRVALALRMLCGFSTAEIARAATHHRGQRPEANRAGEGSPARAGRGVRHAGRRPASRSAGRGPRGRLSPVQSGLLRHP